MKDEEGYDFVVSVIYEQAFWSVEREEKKERERDDLHEDNRSQVGRQRLGCNPL